MKHKCWLIQGCVLILIGLFFGQTIAAGPHLSLTADEPVHMAQGYVYWIQGDFRLQRPVAQPPLPDLLPGAFLTLQPGPNIEQLAGWADADLSRFSRAFIDWYGDRDVLPAATFASRAPIALIAVIGVAFAFRWAREAFGAKGGLLTVTLLAFDPNFIAHAGLATTDVLLAVWTFGSVYAASQWMKSRRVWPWGLMTGLFLGFALGSKTSGFFAPGMIGLLFSLRALGNIKDLRTAPGDLLTRAVFWLKRYLLTLGLAFLVLWVLYRFEVRPLPGLNLPIPFATHWVIWQEMVTHLQDGHIAYLMGEISHTGWWYYYPLTFLLKTPPPTLILLLAALLAGVKSAQRRWWDRRAIWLPALLYGIAAISSNIDIGYRYLLVMLPFLYILCGGWLTKAKRNWQRWLTAAFIIWLMMSAALTFPHYLAYFNPVIAASDNEAAYLVDSNLDWGQGFIALERWTEKHATQKPLFISYYTFVDPTHYDLDYTPIAPAADAPPVLEQHFDPKPGTYAISATPLQGVMVAQEETHSWFRQREPIARPGNAIFVYEIPEEKNRPEWIAQCTVPVAPLSQEAIIEGFGQADLRQVTFDCTQSWVYPGGGRAAGQYALFLETALADDVFIEQQLLDTSLSYEQKQAGVRPPFRLYARDVGPTQPHHTPDATVQVGEALNFLGYTLQEQNIRPGEPLLVETYWQVRQQSEPISIMLHVSGPEGTPVLVGDGLGFPVDQWQSGDIFVQKHSLPIPEDAVSGRYRLYTGAYDLETITPYRIFTDGTALGERLELTDLQIP